MAGLVNRFGREKLMVLSPLALAATLIVFSLSSPIWMALLTYAFAGFFIRSNVLYRTTAQERTNLNFQGRVESIVGIVSSLIALLLFAAMGALQEFVSPRALYWLQSLILLALAFWAWRVIHSKHIHALVFGIDIQRTLEVSEPLRWAIF